MTVTAVTLHWNGAVGQRSKGKAREYTAVYKVVTNDVNDQAGTIIAHFETDPLLPFIGDSYLYANDSDGLARCDRVGPPQRVDGSAFVWELPLHYAKPDTDKKEEREDANGNATEDPLQWNDEISITLIDYTRPVEKAIYRSGFIGTAAALWPIGVGDIPHNSAGTPFDPPLERQATRMQFRIGVFLGQFPDSDAVPYHRAINSDIWSLRSDYHNFLITFQPYQTQLVNLSGEFAVTNDVKHWKATYEILADFDFGFREFIADRGIDARRIAGDPDGRGGFVSVIPQGAPQVARLHGAFGNPIGEPVLFNGDGQPLPLGSPPVYLEWSIYPELPFAALIIGS